MLKALPANAFVGMANAKCGEIFCQSSSSFSIVCTFCELKCFDFADFLLHFKNVHFENDLLKTDELTTLSMERTVKLLKQEDPELIAAMITSTPTSSISFLLANDDNFNAHNNNDDDKKIGDDNQPNQDTFYDNNDQGDDDVDALSAQKTVKIMNWRNTGNRTTKVSLGQQQNQPQRKRKTLDIMEADYILDHSDAEDEIADDDDDDFKPPKQSKITSLRSQLKCDKCDKVYHSKGSLVVHIRREHSSAEPVVCEECTQEFPRQRQLDVHLIELHGGIPCTQCGRRYKKRTEMKRHEIKHTGQRNVICDHEGCGKHFFTIRNMHSHRKVHLEEKNFVCDYCGYSCRNKETLRVHARIHTGERPYTCDICDKSFISQSRLREHQQMHSTTRSHACNVCGAKFARQKTLYHHKFLHLESKKFVCKICGNAYAQQAGLAGHMRKHKEGIL